MSHPVNDEILERLYEQYEIYAKPSEDNVGIHEYYVIKDENNELVQHKDKIFFPTKSEAELALFDIVYKQFEELPEPLDLE